jgi:YD repeat-containing protein
MPKETKAQRHLRIVSEVASKALRDGFVLMLQYDGFERVVEVHAIGVSTGGLPCMRVYQVRGSDNAGWRMLLLHKVERDMEILDDPSEAPRPGYKRGDKGMLSVSEEL